MKEKLQKINKKIYGIFTLTLSCLGIISITSANGEIDECIESLDETCVVETFYCQEGDCWTDTYGFPNFEPLC